MTWRTGHGNGAGVPRIEVLPADELPSATPAVAVRQDRDEHGRFRAGNVIGKNKRLRASISAFRADPRVAPFLRWGRRYGAHRRRELARAHGGEISAGVGAIVESAAQAMAASRYLQALASETGDAELFRQSSQLAATARQHELAAWELAAREAAARPDEHDDLRARQEAFQRELARRQAEQGARPENASTSQPDASTRGGEP